MDSKELLKNYKEQIDTLDKELLYLFSRRQEIAKQMGLLKKESAIEKLTGL